MNEGFRVLALCSHLVDKTEWFKFMCSNCVFPFFSPLEEKIAAEIVEVKIYVVINEDNVSRSHVEIIYWNLH